MFAILYIINISIASFLNSDTHGIEGTIISNTRCYFISMGAGIYFRNILTLYTENSIVINLAIFGFFFFICGIFLIENKSIPGGLLFCWCAVLLLWSSWYHLKHKDTPEYGKSITFDWKNRISPEYKKWVVIAWLVIFLALFFWLVLSAMYKQHPGILENRRIFGSQKIPCFKSGVFFPKSISQIYYSTFLFPPSGFRTQPCNPFLKITFTDIRRNKR
jgi:hypothetical protein